MAENPRTTYVFIERDGKFVPAGKLDVYGSGRYGRSVFQYGRRYAERRDAVAVDPEMLPLPGMGGTFAPVDTPEDFELFNGIRDAAPDGWGRYLMNKAAPSAVFEEFDYLVASGDDRVGALAFGPDPSKPPQRVMPWPQDPFAHKLDLVELADTAARIETMDELSPEDRRFLEQGSSLGGARPKATTTLQGRSWIAKFARKDDSYNVSRAELSAMKLAAECGLTVPETQAIRIRDVDVYLVERFDRTVSNNGTLTRIPFVSSLTMLGAHELSAHRYSYVDLSEAVRKHGSDPSKDMRELFGRMAFNILCSNDDDHLRNHGFLHDGRGWRLSPAYDIVPKPQIGHERRLVLGIGDRGKEATLANAMTQCERFGLRPDEAADLLERMRALVAARWEAVCRDSGVPAGEIQRLSTCFQEAMREDWANESGVNLAV